MRSATASLRFCRIRPIRPSCSPRRLASASGGAGSTRSARRARRHTRRSSIAGSSSRSSSAATSPSAFPGLRWRTRSSSSRTRSHATTRTDSRVPLRRAADMLLKLLADAKAHGDEVHAALYELSDHELITGSPRSVLARTSCSRTARSQAKGEHAADARKRDQNAAGRAALLQPGSTSRPHDRFISPPALGHNKFLVVQPRRDAGAGLDRQHQLDADRPLHAAQQRPADLGPRGGPGIPHAVAGAARRRQLAPGEPGRARTRTPTADRARRPQGRGALHARARQGRPRTSSREIVPAPSKACSS